MDLNQFRRLAMQNNFRQNLYIELIVIILFICASLIYFWPAVTHFTTSLPGNQDELFITFAITKMARKFPQPLDQLFDSGIFYPVTNSQVFSDLFITSGILVKPFLAYFKEPVVAFNTILLIGQFLTLYSCYLLLKQMTKNKLISFQFSLVFGYSLIHLHYIPHLHTFFIAFVPLSGWILLRWIENNKIVWFYLWFLVLGLQILNSPLPAYFILYLTCFLIWSKPESIKLLKNNFKHLIIAIVSSYVFFYPFIKAYFVVSDQHNYQRPLSEVVHFSLSPEKLGGPFFSPILFGATLFVLIWLIKKRKLDEYKIWLTGMLGALVLSLGPVLHWMGKTVKIPFPIPLPYLLFYFLIPGFNSFRTPSRWLNMFALMAIILSALVWHKFIRKEKTIIMTCLIVLINLICFTPRYSNYVMIPTFDQVPPIYQWLKVQPQKIVVELPMAAWDKEEQTEQEIMRMYWSLYHGKILVNGYSGFFPQSHLQLTSITQKQFPDKASLSALQNSGAQILLIHLDQYGEKKDLITNKVYEILGEPNFLLDQVWVYKLP